MTNVDKLNGIRRVLRIAHLVMPDALIVVQCTKDGADFTFRWNRMHCVYWISDEALIDGHRPECHIYEVKRKIEESKRNRETLERCFRKS